jgi:hypothetical protein
MKVDLANIGFEDLWKNTAQKTFQATKTWKTP